MLTDYQTLVDAMVRDQSSLIEAADRDMAIEMAVTRYSTDRPREIVQYVTGDASGFLPLPAAWQDGLSHLTKVGDYDFEIVPTVEGPMIAVSSPVEEGEQVLVRFETGHTLNDQLDTIPVSDQEAVASYAAAELLDQLAASNSGESHSTIQTDNMSMGNKGNAFARRAETRRQRYLDHLGLEEKRTEAAGTVVDWDMGSSRGGDRLFRTRGLR